MYGSDVGVMPRPLAWELAAATIAGDGTLYDVTEDDQGRVHVTIASPGLAAPAMDRIGDDLVDTLTAAGYLGVDVEFVLAHVGPRPGVPAPGSPPRA